MTISRDEIHHPSVIFVVLDSGGTWNGTQLQRTSTRKLSKQPQDQPIKERYALQSVSVLQWPMPTWKSSGMDRMQ